MLMVCVWVCVLVANVLRCIVLGVMRRIRNIGLLIRRVRAHILREAGGGKREYGIMTAQFVITQSEAAVAAAWQSQRSINQSIFIKSLPLANWEEFIHLPAKRVNKIPKTSIPPRQSLLILTQPYARTINGFNANVSMMRALRTCHLSVTCAQHRLPHKIHIRI